MTPRNYSILTLALLTACPPDGNETSDPGTTTATPSTITNPATSLEPSTTDDASTGITDQTTGTPTTGEPPIMGGPCDGVQDDEECRCEGVDNAFCNALDIFCRAEVGLDLSQESPPGTDYCDSIFAWCTTKNANTFAACFLLQSTCEQVAPSGNVNDCEGVRDACACNDFVLEEDTTGGGESSTGEDVLPEGCQSNANCLPGEFCDDQQWPAVCVPRGAPQDGEVNGPCTVLTCWECHLSEPLGGSICVAACKSDDECVNGTTCINEECIYPCGTDNDCPFTTMVCDPLPAPGMCMWKA